MFTRSRPRRVSASPYFRVLTQPCPRKILLENSLIADSAHGHHVRAFLTKTEAVSEAAATKNKIRSRARNFKPRALKHVPAQHAAHNDLEIPPANRLALVAFEGDEFRPTGLVALCDFDSVQSRSNVST